MMNLLEQFYATPSRVQDGVLFLMLESSIYLIISFIDLYLGNEIDGLGTPISFAMQLSMVTAIALCGLGMLYRMRAGWIGSMVMSVVLISIGVVLMLHLVEYTVILSGLFYFIFGIISFLELTRKEFREYCGISRRG